MLSPLVVAVSLCAALVAVITDLRHGKIRNWLTLPLLAVGPTIWLAQRGLAGALISIEGALLVAAILVGLVAVVGPGLGGGDLKLLVGLGAVLGWPTAGWMLLYTGLSGVIAIPVLLKRRVLLRTVGNLAANLALRHYGGSVVRLDANTPAPPIPYGACIFLGTIAALLLGPIV